MFIFLYLLNLILYEIANRISYILIKNSNKLGECKI